MKKGENGRYSLEYRLWAVEQLRKGVRVSELAQRTGVHRTRLYRWRRDPEHPDAPQPARADKPAQELTAYEELQQVKQALAEKVLELDFLKGALQRIEARRQKSASSGETTSMEKSKP